MRKRTVPRGDSRRHEERGATDIDAGALRQSSDMMGRRRRAGEWQWAGLMGMPFEEDGLRDGISDRNGDDEMNRKLNQWEQ